MNASTVRLCNALWTAGNNAGQGYAAPGETVEDAVAAYEARPFHVVLHRARNTSEVSIVQTPGKLIVIGDSDGGWAVDVPASALDG